MKARHRHLLTFGTLGLVMPASADVIYSNLQNIAIPATFDGLYLNVETGAWSTSMAAPVAGWDINPFYGGRAFANSPDFQPVRSGTTSSSAILNLAAGATVGSGSVFSTFVQGATGETPGAPGYGGSQMLTGSGGNFTASTEGYLGFRLNGTNYGSMRVVLTNNTSGAYIKDWAYDTSGASVVVGAIKQVGQDVIMSSGFTLASALVNSGGTTNLIKNGSGTNTLSAASTYSGITTVNAGVLAVNGTLANTSTVTVANTATLRGNGSIGGSVTVQSGGTIAAGNSIESLTTGALGLNGGSTFAYEMNNDAAPLLAGDLIAVTGNLTFDLTTAASLTLAELGTGSWTVGDKLTLISYSGLWNGGLLDYGSPLLDGSTFSYSGMQWLFNYDDTSAGSNYTGDLTGSSFVTMTAVPEPNVAALIGGFGILALLRRRR